MKKLTAIAFLSAGLMAVVVGCKKKDTASPTPTTPTCYLTKAKSSDNKTTYVYDANNRVSKEIDSSGSGNDTTTFTYNTSGQVSRMYVNNQNTSDEYYDYAWGTNTLTVHKFSVGTTGTATEIHKAVVQYSSGSLISRITYYDRNGANFDLISYATATNDANGNITKFSDFDNNGKATGSTTVTYDANNNPARNIPSNYEELDIIGHSANNGTKLTIDDGTTPPTVIDLTYTYDTNKNPTSVTGFAMTTNFTYNCK